MSRDSDPNTEIDASVDRRTMLSAATAAAGTAGLSSVAAAAEDDGDLTATEVEQALADAEIVPFWTDDVDAGDVEPSPSQIPDDADVFVGKYKNAEVPGEDAYEIQSIEEWQRQQAPTGYTKAEFESNVSESLYLKETTGEITVAGYTVEFGIGVGAQFTVSGGELQASLSVDVYINGASFAITEFVVGRGPDGLCLEVPIKYGPIPGLVIDICLDFQVTLEGDKVCLEISVSGELCADPCPVITCAYCASVSTPELQGCVNNPL